MVKSWKIIVETNEWAGWMEIKEAIDWKDLGYLSLKLTIHHDRRIHKVSKECLWNQGYGSNKRLFTLEVYFKTR